MSIQSIYMVYHQQILQLLPAIEYFLSNDFK